MRVGAAADCVCAAAAGAAFGLVFWADAMPAVARTSVRASAELFTNMISCRFLAIQCPTRLPSGDAYSRGASFWRNFGYQTVNAAGDCLLTVPNQSSVDHSVSKGSEARWTWVA